MSFYSRNCVFLVLKLVLVVTIIHGASYSLSSDAFAAKTSTAAETQPVSIPRIGMSTSGNYLAGRQAQNLNDFGIAAEFMSAVLRDRPNSPTILRRTFVMMVMIGRMDDAARLAKQMEKLLPDDQIGNLVRVAIDLKGGKYESAGKRLSSAQQNGLNSIISPALMAWIKAGEGKPVGEAVKEFDAMKPVKGKPQALKLEHIALINSFSGNNDLASKQFKELFDDEAWKALRFTQHYGEFMERQGKWEEARAIYDRFTEIQPGTRILDLAKARIKENRKPEARISTAIEGVAEVLFDVASSLNQQNARDTALILARIGHFLKPDFPALEYMMANILDLSDRLEEALGVYQDIQPNTEFSRPAKLSIVSLLDRLEETEQALDILRKLAAEQKQESRPLVVLGNILRRHERYEEASEAYDEAVSRIGTLQPHHWNLLYSRGITLERSKKWDRAEADFLKALEFMPDQPFVLNYLGYSWVEKGINLARAEKMIQTAVKKRPTDGYIIDSLGWIYYQLGKFDQAVDELERAVELRPQDPVINDHLGDAYWRVGRKLEASFQWKKAIDQKPEQDVIDKILIKLESGMGEPEILINTKEGKTSKKAATKG